MTIRNRFLIGGLAAAAAAWLAYSGVVVAKKKPAARERVSVVAIEVPVNVTKGGKPVRGLTVDQFELLDDGKPQKILGMTVLDLGDGTSPSRPADRADVPVAARRHFLLLFDLSFTATSSLQRAREAARTMIDTSMHSDDLVAVATYVANRGVKLLVNFTTDRGQALAAVDLLREPDGRQRLVDPLGMTIMEPEAMFAEAGRVVDNAAEGAAAAAQYLAVIGKMANDMDRRSRQAYVSGLTRDMELFAQLLDSVRGRKHVIYLSEGLDDELSFATEDRAEIATMNNAADRGQIWEIDSAQRFGDTTRQSQLTGMIDALRRADCVVHSIDVGGATVDTDTPGTSKMNAGGNQGLSAIAYGTGGTFARNTNELSGAMNDLLDLTSVTYLLTYQPKNLPKDGNYHKLKVKLKDAPRGTKVIHRPGYVESRSYQQRSPEERRLELAGRLLAEQEGGSLSTAAMALSFEYRGGQALVPLLAEVDGLSLLDGHVGDQLALQIFVYALDEEGTIHDVSAQSLGIDLGQAREALSRTGLKYYTTLELDPGNYVLRMLVLNPQSGQSYLSLVDLAVPEQQDDRSLFLLVPEPVGTWLLARKDPDASEAERPPFPFMAGNQPFLPAVTPVIRGDTAELYLIGHRVDPGSLRATLQFSGSGGAASTVEAPVTRAAAGMPGYETLASRFDLTGLDPGRYDVQVTLTSEAGEQRQAELSLEVAR